MKPTHAITLLAGMLLFGVSCSQKGGLSDMMDADKAFSTMSEEQGMNNAFKAFCAEQGVLLRDNSFPVVGKESVTELLDNMDDSEYSLTWEPLGGMIARSGELGYTYGTYTIRDKVTSSANQGTYVSVWVKEGGQWKYVLDSGNEGLHP